MTPHERNRRIICCLCLQAKSRRERSKAGTLDLLTCTESKVTIKLEQLLVDHSPQNPFHPTLLCSLCYQRVFKLLKDDSANLNTMVTTANKKFRSVPRTSPRTVLPPVCTVSYCFVCATDVKPQHVPPTPPKKPLGRPKRSPTAPFCSTSAEKSSKFQISIRDMCYIQSETGVSDKILLRFATCLRVVMKDRKFIEPGLQEALTDRNKELEDHFEVVMLACC